MTTHISWLLRTNRPVPLFPILSATYIHTTLHSQLHFPSPYCCFISIAQFLLTPPSSLAQCVLEEMAGQEAELGRLRERAHRLWEGQAAGKGFVHRVSQLSAQYLALSNLTKVTMFPTCKPATLLMSMYLCFCLRNVRMWPNNVNATMSSVV